MTRRGAGIALALCLGAAPALAQVGEPLSAIDWLSESVRTPTPPKSANPAASPRDTPPAVRPPAQGEAPVAGSVATPQVDVTPLGSDTERAVGLWSPTRAGLPKTLWAGSEAARLEQLIAALPLRLTPALQDMLRDMMLARAEPPEDTKGNDFLLARVDRLLASGATGPALALIESAPGRGADLFRRRFDAALLSGHEQAACEAMEADPTLAPTWPARIFCLARGGDWSAAALTLGTARALGDVSQDEDILLSRFLDPDLYEDETLAPPKGLPSPLEFQMRAAVGHPVATRGLPIAYAIADLGGHTGWRARIEAAERLSRARALPPDRLLDIYRQGRPSASGGAWDRVAAVQALDTAISAGDPEAVATALPEAAAAMRAARLEVTFADLWGAVLGLMDLPGAQDDAHRLTLLSPAYAAAASGDSLADAIARGDTSGLDRPSDPRAAALYDAFAGAAPPAYLAELTGQQREGEAILQTIALFESGHDGDPAAMRDALAAFRALGLEDVARRAALQVLLETTPGTQP